MKRLRRLLAVGAGLAVLSSACSLEQEHGYVQSSDGSLSFRHPAHWSDVDVDAVTTEWVRGIDASADPSGDNAGDFVLDEPFVVAQVWPLEPEIHDTVSLDVLRTLALTDRRDPTAANDPSIRLLFVETYVDEHGFEGHHMRFEVDFEDGTAVSEHFAVLDPTRSRVQRVRVACSTVCFDANTAEIDELFGSLRLRP